MGRTCYWYGGTERYMKSSGCCGRRKKTEGQAETEMGRWCDGRCQEVWGRETGGMVQGIGTAGRSFWRRLALKGPLCQWWWWCIKDCIKTWFYFLVFRLWNFIGRVLRLSVILGASLSSMARRPEDISLPVRLVFLGGNVVCYCRINCLCRFL